MSLPEPQPSETLVLDYMKMGEVGGNVKNPQGPICSCPDAEAVATKMGTLTKRDGERILHFERPASVGPAGDGYMGLLDRPQSRMSTLERPNSRSSGLGFERPGSRAAGAYERPGSRAFERPNSRLGDHYEVPSNASGVLDNRILSAVVLERTPCGLGMAEGNLGELRTGQGGMHCSPGREMDRLPQVHSLCCAEWENGLGPQSEWDIDVDIRQHIQQCTCTCNHMGYGNYMDYQQTTCISELPDIAPAIAASGRSQGFYRGQNGSIRCNGRALGTRTAPIHHDSSSCSSKEGSLDDPKGSAATFSMRSWWIGIFISIICTSLALGIGFPLYLSSGRPTTHNERLLLVKKILRDVPLIDGHNDLPWNIRKFVYNQILNFNFTSDLQKVEPWSRSNWSHTDIPRLRAGLMGAQFWSAYVPCEAQGLDAVQLTLDQVDVIRRLTDLYSEHLILVTSVKGVREAHRSGKIASLIGIEGGHSLGNSLAVLRSLYNLGARYLTVTHSCDTAWADCCLSDPPAYGPGGDPPLAHRPGLSEFGKLVVREMNRLGMMIDLSHASVKTMKDALATSQAPVIFSHSSAHALCNSSGNVPDDILKLVALNGGLVMVSFYNYFVTCSSYATLHDVIAHINHIRTVAGIDHVGIGAGFDGINHTPEGLEDVSKYPDLLATLLGDPLWSEEDIKKLVGLNLLRVFAQVEEVKEKWRLAAVRPVEELIPGVYLEGRTDCMYLGS